METTYTSLDRWTDEEYVVCVCVCVCVCNRYYSAIKKNEIMLFAATWMDLESIILGEVNQINIKWNCLYVESGKKNDTNELIYKTEKDP